MIRLLLFGCERSFLRDRRGSLAKAGIQVVAAEKELDARALLRAQCFDVLMIGRKIPAEGRNKIAVLAKSRQKLRVIFLYRGSIAQAESADALITADANTEDLISTIERLAGSTAPESKLSRSAG
jgi:ActR/RegA family two-component response regulator